METKPYQRVWLEEAAPGETFIYKEGKAECEDVQNADIILGNVSPKLISTGDKLKWLQTNSAGVDGYIHGCLPKETVLTNATGAYGLAISEYMVAVWLELLKKLHLYRDVQRTGKWCDLGQVRSAWNSTVLVLGLGDIGGEFAKRAKALGAKVIGVRRTGTDKPDFVDELIHTDKLDEYLPQADCVAITLPGTTATKGMFDAERMAKMKDGAIFKRRPRDDRRHRCAVRGAEKRKACGRGRGRDRPGAAARRSPAVEDGKRGHHTAYLRRIPFAGDARPHCAYYGGEFKAFPGG